MPTPIAVQNAPNVSGTGETIEVPHLMSLSKYTPTATLTAGCTRKAAYGYLAPLITLVLMLGTDCPGRLKILTENSQQSGCDQTKASYIPYLRRVGLGCSCRP